MLHCNRKCRIDRKANGNYQEAIQIFTEAKKCSDATKSRITELDKLISECNKDIQKQKKVKNQIGKKPKPNYTLSISPDSWTFPASGGSKTFDVKTDDPDGYTLSGINSSLFTIESRTKTSLTVRVKENTSTSSKSDYFYVNVRGKYRKINISQTAAKPYFSYSITGIKLGNTTENGTVLNDFGTTLYADSMRYLTPKIYCNVKGNISKDVTFYVKIIRPDGNHLDYNTKKSPVGYTTKTVVHLYQGRESVILTGWGNSEKSYYEAGVYRIEIWESNKKVAEKYFTLHKTEYNLSIVPYSWTFPASGGSKTFDVKTDDPDGYTLSYTNSSLFTIESKTKTSFTVRAKGNTSTSAKNDYFYVNVRGKTRKIFI